jgi:hypothetical protein
MVSYFDEKRSVEQGLKLNSSTKVDGEFRLAQLAQNPLLHAVFLNQPILQLYDKLYQSSCQILCNALKELLCK